MKNLLFILSSFGLLSTSIAQTVTTVNPNLGAQGTWSLPITITGSGTNFSAATNTVVEISQGGFELDILSVNVTSSTSIDAMIRIPHYSFIGPYDVTVSDPSNGANTLPSGFSVYANPNVPAIIETYPDSVRQNATLPVTISTEHTNFAQATDNVIFLTQGTHTLFPIPGTMQVLSNDSIRAVFDFAQPYLSIGTLVNSHCGNSFDGILTDQESILIIDSTLSIFKAEPSEKLSIYPNPTSGDISIDIPKGLVNFELTIYNQLGQAIHRQTVNNNTSHVFKSNIANLPNGVYFVNLQDANARYRVKVIKE